jgi:RHS repeat-associated protein
VHESHLRGAPRRWVYDINGNTQRFHDHDGAQFKFEYTSWNLRKSKIDPLGHATHYEYNPDGLPSALVDSGATRSEYSYDLKGNLQEVRRHGVLKERYRYDMAGNLVEKLDGDNQPLLTIEVGQHNLMTSRKLASGDMHEFVYTDDGRLAAATAGKHLVEFAYNAFAYRTKDMRDGRGVEHLFSDRGRLKKTVILDRFQVSYEILPTGTMRIIDPAGNRHSVQRLGGGLMQRTCSSRTSELTQYDPEGRCVLKVLFIKGSQNALWTRRYRYSGEGDLLSVEDSRSGTTTYTYDAAHRIAKSVSRRANGTREAYFAFDSAGNLLQQPGLAAVTLREGNRLAAANGDQFEYNQRNHIASRSSQSGVLRYYYDSRDMLVRCEMPDSCWQADYDPLSRRMSKTFGERKTEFFWDSDRLIAEINHAGRLRVYVYADHFALTPILFLDYPSVDSGPGSAETFFIFTDHLSSPVRVEDVRGDVVWQAEYDPYGTAHIDPRARIEFNLRFPGHYFDPELNLHYNRFRYYSPELGRYLQSDPIGVAGGMNLYAYTANPLKQVDLRGTSCNGGSSTGDDDDKDAPEDGANQESTGKNLGALPAGATVVRQGDDHVVYELPDGTQRIRFDAENAVTLKEATPDRNNTTDSLAGFNEDGDVYVLEGRHRAIGASQGDVVDPSNGGVADAPGVLDYPYTPNTVDDKGQPVKNMTIDHNQPDVTKDEADRLWEQKYGGGK